MTEIVTPLPVGNDWKKTFKKGAWTIGYAAIVAIIVAAMDFINATTFPPEYAIYVGLALSVLKMTHNYLDHRNDNKVV